MTELNNDAPLNTLLTEYSALFVDCIAVKEDTNSTEAEINTKKTACENKKQEIITHLQTNYSTLYDILVLINNNLLS